MTITPTISQARRQLEVCDELSKITVPGIENPWTPARDILRVLISIHDDGDDSSIELATMALRPIVKAVHESIELAIEVFKEATK